LKQLVNPDAHGIDDFIHCEWVETEPVDSSVFTNILTGLLNKTRIRIAYRAPAEKNSTRDIDPLKLVNYQGRWYILAWCFLRKSRRMFHMARIISAEATDTKSEHRLEPEDDWLSGSFGIFKGDTSKRYTAEIFFKGKAADIIRRQRWHPEQKTKDTGEGLIMELPVNDDREIIMKVLQFGHLARVLAPESLQQKLCEEIKKMGDQYNDSGK
jgi:predicted DNA-binding transcriptional regulator YafY